MEKRVNYRIISMRLNQAPTPPGGQPVPETATLELAPAESNAGLGTTSVIVSDWSSYQLGQICDLTPQPIAA